MVGPISDGERASFRRKLKVGTALLVGLSGALVAVQIDARPVQVAGAGVLGLALGAVLAWYIVPSRDPIENRRSGLDRDNPFADGGDGGDASSETETGDGSDRTRRR